MVVTGCQYSWTVCRPSGAGVGTGPSLAPLERLQKRPQADATSWRAACRVPPPAKIMSWEIGLVPMLLVCNVADWIWAEDGRGLRLNPISAATPTALLHKSASCRRSTVSQLSSETQNKSGNCFGRSCVSGRKMRTFWLPLFVIAFAQIT